LLPPVDQQTMAANHMHHSSTLTFSSSFVHSVRWAAARSTRS